MKKNAGEAERRDMRDTLDMYLTSYQESFRLEGHLSRGDEKYQERWLKERLDNLNRSWITRYKDRIPLFQPAMIASFTKEKNFRHLLEYMRAGMHDVIEIWRKHELYRHETNALHFIEYAFNINKNYPNCIDFDGGMLLGGDRQHNRVQAWAPVSEWTMEKILNQWLDSRPKEYVVNLGEIFMSERMQRTCMV